MRIPKYFYVTSVMDPGYWQNANGELREPNQFSKFIGSGYWPFTRDEARKCSARCTRFIYQFENKPPYKFIKQVR